MSCFRLLSRSVFLVTKLIVLHFLGSQLPKTTGAHTKPSAVPRYPPSSLSNQDVRVSFMARRLESAIGRPEDRDTHEVCTNFLMYGCHITNTLQTPQPLPPRPNDTTADNAHAPRLRATARRVTTPPMPEPMTTDNANANKGQRQRQQRTTPMPTTANANANPSAHDDGHRR